MSRLPPLDLYFVTDSHARAGVIETALAAVRGGASVVQLRDKTADDESFVALGRALRDALAPMGVPLCLNDRAHLLGAIGADGLHVGQTDIDPVQARALVGPEVFLGLSIETAKQLTMMPQGVVDYIGIGPIRATSTKPDAATPLGIEGFTEIARNAPCPSVAIGGITAADAHAIRAGGGAGLAVVSAISAAPDPEAAARTILTAWRTP